MKKLIFLVAIAAMFAACNEMGNKQKQLQSKVDSLQKVLDNRQVEESELLNAFNAVQEGFRLMSEAEGRVYAQQEQGISAVEQVKTDMAFIAQTLKGNRELIEQLKKKLATSNATSTQMKQTLDNLTAQLVKKTNQLAILQNQLATKEIYIASLDSMIASLQGDVTLLRAENQAKERTLDAQDKALNAAWFVYGTKKELKEQNILNDRLLAKDRILESTDFNQNYFTQIDIRKDTVIKFYSRSAKLMTMHPEGSYELTKDEKSNMVLQITNPTDFWSVSRYLVVLVK